MTFLNAKLQSGIETVLDVVHFDEYVKDCDLVISGEGRIDHQSMYGKVPTGVSQRAKNMVLTQFVLLALLEKMLVIFIIVLQRLKVVLIIAAL